MYYVRVFKKINFREVHKRVKDITGKGLWKGSRALITNGRNPRDPLNAMSLPPSGEEMPERKITARFRVQ